MLVLVVSCLAVLVVMSYSIWAVHRDKIMIRANSVVLSVTVGEKTALKESVIGSFYTWNKMTR